MNKIPVDVIVRIEGHSELIRDPKTGAVINTAVSEYQQFVSLKEKERQQQRRIRELENSLESLQNKYDDLEGKIGEIWEKLK